MPHTINARSVLSLDEELDDSLVGAKAAGLDEGGIPDEAWCGIVDAWRTLAAPVVIVRSSGIGEDSAGASFAGQLDSISGVKDSEELRRAVLQCWRSRGSE